MQIVDFGELPVFVEASTFPVIVLVKKNSWNGQLEFT